MSTQSVIFMGPSDEPIIASEFIKTQLPELQASLEDAASQLASTTFIAGHRAGKLPSGKWSIWLEDTSGERHNFLLYLSELQSSCPSPSAQQTSSSKLGVWVTRGHAQAETTSFIDAAEYIEQNYSGEIRNQLLRSLERALSGQASFDGTIERTSSGVTLRVLQKDQQVRKYSVEVQLSWQ